MSNPKSLREESNPTGTSWLDDLLYLHLHEIKAGHDNKLRRAILDHIEQLVAEGIEAARSKAPYKCEYGHEVYGHNTVDGWCCACEADIAFAAEWIKDEPEFEQAVKDHIEANYKPKNTKEK